ncbi:fasciclin domain-containing protein [Thalassotalea maritima]|uniref:fasciclin domain-containing protein n=1 Tax=Thalassotalea maritima TaxID=3242416 RepID=UPI0035299E94
MNVTRISLAKIFVAVILLYSASVFAGGGYGKKDIVDTAASNDTFSTLVAAVQAADLVDTLKGDGPFTVFAATNEAFAKLPAGTLEDLLKPENKDKLAAILTYHVVAGEVMAADVVSLSSATSVQGGDIAVTVSDTGVQINEANVIKTDIKTSNGVIHVIDSVILPPAE